jgi:hypothetical protein
MRPEGVQFGLSRNLLKLQGEQVFFADGLLEAVSAAAEEWIRFDGPPIEGNFLVDLSIRAADKLLDDDREGDGIAPFFEDLNRTMFYTFCEVAQSAGLAKKMPTRLLTDPGLWAEFVCRSIEARVESDWEEDERERALFKICRQLVHETYSQRDPQNIRHADLMALFIFNFWNFTGLLPIALTLVFGKE